VTSIGGSILHGITSALGISSPSREMHKLGQFAVQGLINGLASGSSDLAQTSQKLALAAASGLGGGLFAPRVGLALPGAGAGGVLGSASQPLRLQMELVHKSPSGQEINRELVIFQRQGGVFTAAKAAMG
jgi:hypothetical protein